MGKEKLKTEQIAPGQVCAAALLGGLSPAVTAAEHGWQGAALAIPVVLLAGWSLRKRIRCRRAPLGRSVRFWSAVLSTALMARGLSRSASRLAHTGGGGEGAKIWLLLLLALPLVWMAAGGEGTFFRAAALWAPGILAVRATVLIWAFLRGEWGYALEGPVSLSGGVLAAVESGGTFLFAILYNNIEKEGEGGVARAGWRFPALAVGTALIALAASVVLSPGVLPAVQEPFFTAVASLGRSVRVDGVLSALWIAADLVYLALLSRGWGRGRLFGVILAVVLALLGIPEYVPAEVYGVGVAVLWGVCLVGGRGKRKNSVSNIE